MRPQCPSRNTEPAKQKGLFLVSPFLMVHCTRWSHNLFCIFSETEFTVLISRWKPEDRVIVYVVRYKKLFRFIQALLSHIIGSIHRLYYWWFSLFTLIGRSNKYKTTEGIYLSLDLYRNFHKYVISKLITKMPSLNYFIVEGQNLVLYSSLYRAIIRL